MSALDIPAKPDDFDAYWQAVLDELDATPAAPELEALPLRSTDYDDTYIVNLTSIGPYRLRGYLSIPHGAGPFPAEMQFPRYGSVLEVFRQGDCLEKRARSVILSVGHRGMRHCDSPYSALYPGLLTDGILDPRSYIFRGIVADCCRWIEFLMARPEVEASHVAAFGFTDLPLLAMALCPGPQAALTSCSLFHAALSRAEATESYPLEELNDLIRLHPERREAVARTLAYFEPAHFAERIAAELFLWGDETQLAPLTGRFGGPVEVHAAEGSQYKDGVTRERWMSKRLGFDEPIVPEHWR